MEQRRFLLFITLATLAFLGWFSLGPRLFPGLFPKPKPPAQKEEEPAKPKKVARGAGPIRAPRPDEQPAVKPVQPDKVAAKPDKPKAKPPKKQTGRTISLGSTDPDSGYFMRADLVTRGAAVDRVFLSDPRYRELADREHPLAVIGESDSKLKTLATPVKPIDDQLADFGLRLAETDWEVVENKLVADADGLKDDDGNPVYSAVAFRYTAPDGTLRVEKTYRVARVDLSKGKPRNIRDNDNAGYMLHCDITFTNLSATTARKVTYEMQGPVGVPLEDVENARVYRSIRMGFLTADGELNADDLTAKAFIKAKGKDRVETWTSPLRYIGVDVQYFAVLVLPGGDQLKNQYIAEVTPHLENPNDEADDAAHNRVTVYLKSSEIELAPGQSATHSYRLYAGPKRKALLEELGATDVIDFGWFGFIAKGMLWLMNLLNRSLAFPYGIAIICLTIIVRGMMFPLSKKQAASAKKMKELQPKIVELKKKYAGDREKMAKAQMELFQKHGYNPFAGCLPILMQLPIFFGLYKALSLSVDLRMAEFLWIDNLAAPDALFKLPFKMWFLGSSFNLLPILTVIIFVFQQKMFMPPATDDQTAMQQKMMMYMSIFFGFLFYRVPAGLCVYFIASSLWGMGERKMLDYGGNAEPEPAGDDGDEAGGSGRKKPTGPDDEPPEKKPGLLGRLLAAADQAGGRTASGGGNGQEESRPSNRPGGNRGKGKKRRKRSKR